MTETRLPLESWLQVALKDWAELLQGPPKDLRTEGFELRDHADRIVRLAAFVIPSVALLVTIPLGLTPGAADQIPETLQQVWFFLTGSVFFAFVVWLTFLALWTRITLTAVLCATFMMITPWLPFTALFFGNMRTLIDPDRFSRSDLRNAASLLLKLRDSSDPTTDYLRARFSEPFNRVIDNYDGEKPPDEVVRSLLLYELNEVVASTQVDQALAPSKIPEIKRREINLRELAKAFPQEIRLDRPTLLTLAHLRNPEGLAAQIRDAREPPARYLRKRVAHRFRAFLDQYDESKPLTPQQIKILLYEINRVVRRDRLDLVLAPPEAVDLTQRTKNVRILANAYPGHLETSRRVPHWLGLLWNAGFYLSIAAGLVNSSRWLSAVTGRGLRSWLAVFAAPLLLLLSVFGLVSFVFSGANDESARALGWLPAAVAALLALSILMFRLLRPDPRAEDGGAT